MRSGLEKRIRSLQGSWSNVLTSESHVHRWVMAVVAVAVAVGAVWSANRLGVAWSQISWWPAFGVLTVSLASPLLSAAEYSYGLRLVGRRTPSDVAIRVAVYSTLANILPLPGGFLVRMKAMTEQGARATVAAGAQLFVGLVWLAVALATLTVVLPSWRFLALAFGLGLIAVCFLLLRKNSYHPQAALALVMVEALYVLSAAVRFYLVLSALGVTVTVPAALALAAAGPLAAATGLVPGSLGILEALSAAMAALVGLDPASGFLAALLLRLLTYIGLLPWIPLTRPRPPSHDTGRAHRGE